MDCASCGKELVQEFKFCPFCGGEMTFEEPASSVDTTVDGDSVAEETVEMAALADATIMDLPVVQLDGGDDNATRLDTPAVALNNEKSDEPAPKDPGDQRFSETAWFMAAVSPEQLATSEGEPTDFTEQERMTEAYETETPLPDEVRKEYSLTLTRTKAVQPEDLKSDPPKK